MAEWETGRRAPVDELSDMDRRLANALGEADGGRLIVDERRDGVWVSAKSWIGIVRFTDWEIRVVPKLAGGNLGVVRMLDYASGIGALKRYEARRELETVGESLLELIAWLFAEECARLVRDGLLSDYVAREDSLHTLRGHLRLMAQVQQRFGRVEPLEVAFDEFETDIPENQIIAAALDATRSIVRVPVVQKPIRRLHSIFHEACDPSEVDPGELLNDLAYNRKNEHYRGAHTLAQLLLRRLAVRDLFSPGGTNSFAFLIDMNELFEAFVSRLAADALEPVGIHVHAQRRDPSIVVDDATGKPYAAIIPDLLLEARSHGASIRLPVDAKYKLYDQKRIQESDVYQTFFYAFAYAAETHIRRPARAVILYPRAGDGNDISLRVDTHAGRHSARIQAFGVDIEAALAAITRGKVGVGDVPALGRLRQVFQEVVAEVDENAEWLASSA
jgi:5-methylcytosine-specific restriction enzyme subunit McrC